MKNIFTKESIKSIEHYFDNELSGICYYPSSGLDFRHIFYWDHYSKHQSEFPNIFLYSDLLLFDNTLFKSFKKSSIFNNIYKSFNDKNISKSFNTEIIDEFGANKRLEVTNWIELELSENIFYRNIDNLNFPYIEVKNENRFIGLECKLITKNKISRKPLMIGDKITTIDGAMFSLLYEFPITVLAKDVKTKTGKYFNKSEIIEYQDQYTESSRSFLIILASMENSNFFYDVILKNGIKIKYLTHIMDGGASKGLSKRKMDYIYKFINECKISNILVDQTLEQKTENVLKYWQDYKYKNPKSNISIKCDKFLTLDIKTWSSCKKVYFPEPRKIMEGHNDWQYSHFNIMRNDNYETNFDVWKQLAGYYDGLKEKWINTYYHYERKWN